MIDWHNRFVQQARWTAEIRAYLIQRINLQPAQRILEVGCGSGAVLATLPTHSRQYGLDVDFDFLAIARREAPNAALTCGNAYYLPFANASFDHCICHFFLMWVRAEDSLAEMIRVTRPGGTIIALAEPDYGGRIDFPEELAQLGRLQADALAANHADPNAGRKLRHWFNRAGLTRVECGVLGGQWRAAPSPQDLDMEWSIIRADLAEQIEPAELIRWEHIDRQAWKAGSRILYVPTFYALGFVA